MNGRCSDEKQSILEPNYEFLTNEDSEEQNDEDAEDDEIELRKHRSRPQEQERKADRAGAKKAPPMEDEKP